MAWDGLEMSTLPRKVGLPLSSAASCTSTVLDSSLRPVRSGKGDAYSVSVSVSVSPLTLGHCPAAPLAAAALRSSRHGERTGEGTRPASLLPRIAASGPAGEEERPPVWGTSQDEKLPGCSASSDHEPSASPAPRPTDERCPPQEECGAEEGGASTGHPAGAAFTPSGAPSGAPDES